MMKTAIIALTGVLACSAAKAVRTATPAEMPVTTNRIVVADRGIVADGKTDQSAAIQRLADGALLRREPPGAHRDVRVIGNRFVDCGNCGLFISSTDGVAVKGNVFKRCSANRYDAAETNALYDVWLNNCADIDVGRNRSDKPAGRSLVVTQNRGK